MAVKLWGLSNLFVSLISPKDHLISSRPLQMVRENTPYLNIVVTILQTPQNSPKTKGEDGTRRAMRERGLQARSSNCTGERVTRDEGLKREVVRRQFPFL